MDLLLCSRFIPRFAFVGLSLWLGSPAFGAASPADFPGAAWENVTPESCGYSSRKLEVLRSWLGTLDTTALVVSVHGKLIFQYGDITKVSKIASVRKSILGMLYGNPVVSGKIDLAQTVKQLGLEEKVPLLPIEEHATLEQLLTARSGIYLPSGDDELDLLTPRRGSQYPGTAYSYNNWDFNAAGSAFEKLTGRNLYDALEADLARPIGMQDFNRALQVKVPARGSVHPEYAMYLSTRDLARVGVLMLRLGNWNGKQLIPADWCRYLTHLTTPFNELNPVVMRISGRPERWGYGVLWWVWDAPAYPGNVTMGPF